MNRTQLTEADVRGILHHRPTSMLLAVWEVTETIRDTHDTPAILIEAAVAFIDWTIDELDRRYPAVMPRWHALTEAGHTIDLAGLFAHEYAREGR